jgi:hypothetical protein
MFGPIAGQKMSQQSEEQTDFQQWWRPYPMAPSATPSKAWLSEVELLDSTLEKPEQSAAILAVPGADGGTPPPSVANGNVESLIQQCLITSGPRVTTFGVGGTVKIQRKRKRNKDKTRQDKTKQYKTR